MRNLLLLLLFLLEEPATRCAFVHRDGAPAAHVAVSNRADGVVKIYNVESGNKDPVGLAPQLCSRRIPAKRFHIPFASGRLSSYSLTS